MSLSGKSLIEGDCLVTPGRKGPNYRVIDVLHEYVGKQSDPAIRSNMVITKHTITVTLEEEALPARLAAESVGLEPLDDGPESDEAFESEDLSHLAPLRFNAFGVLR